MGSMNFHSYGEVVTIKLYLNIENREEIRNFVASYCLVIHYVGSLNANICEHHLIITCPLISSRPCSWISL